MKRVILVLCCLCVLVLSSLTASAAYVFDDTGYYSVSDANRDGAVDIRDLVRVKRHLADRNVDICTKAVDSNGDGTVDAGDLTAVAKGLIGVDSTLESGGEYWSEYYQ